MAPKYFFSLKTRQIYRFYESLRWERNELVGAPVSVSVNRLIPEIGRQKGKVKFTPKNEHQSWANRISISIFLPFDFFCSLYSLVRVPLNYCPDQNCHLFFVGEISDVRAVIYSLFTTLLIFCKHGKFLPESPLQPNR